MLSSPEGDNMEVASSFNCLGSMFASDNALEAEIGHRLARAALLSYRCRGQSLVL